MPLSSVLGASTLIKPGVVTSSTRPSVPYEGQLIYETDTDRIAAYNGAAWITQNGLQLLTSQTVTGLASFSLPANIFSSTYANYKIVGSFTSTATGSSQTITMRLRSSGSDNTSSNYRYAHLRGSSAISPPIGVSALDTSFLLQPAITAPNRFTMSLDILNPQVTEHTFINGTVGTLQNDADMFAGIATGVMTVTTSYDSATFTVSSGTFTGSYRVYGYANN